MCYHTATPSKKQLKKAFADKEIAYAGEEIFHVSGFVRPTLPVTLNENPTFIEGARWKLLPFWVKTEADAAKYANTLNADADSIFEKASYKNYIGKTRGLLYVSGFYEPHQVKGEKESQNYFIYKPAHEIFTLGIVYAPWKSQETGEFFNTFSIITTEANELLEEIHNVKKRMPLIIGSDDREGWLNAQDQEEVERYFKPYAGELDAHQVYRVTAARGEDTNKKEIQNPI